MKTVIFTLLFGIAALVLCGCGDNVSKESTDQPPPGPVKGGGLGGTRVATDK